MSDDNLFRLILIANLACMLPIALFYRVRAHATGERLDRLQEGLFLLISIRTIGAAGMIGCIAFLINPEWMRWSAITLPTWVRFVGVGIGIAAALLLVWTFHNLGPNLTDTVVTRRHHTLITTGPYHWVRHPFCLTVLLVILANALAMANWFVLLAGLVVFVLLVVRTGIEEDKLVERFGDDYRLYMERTGRFFPRWRVSP